MSIVQTIDPTDIQALDILLLKRNDTEYYTRTINLANYISSLLVTGVSSVNGGTGAVTITVTGTTNKIDVSGGTGLTPTITISPTYIGQTSITTLGTIGTGVWNGTSIGTTYTDAKIKTVTGTTNRLTIGGTSTDPTFDISTSYVGQATITTLGTITTGTWNGTAIGDTYISSAATWNAKESALTFSTGLTRSTNTITSNLSVGVSGGQSVIGGTAVGDALNIKGTTGNGTSTVAAINFLVGNNGATTAMSVYNSGQINIGTYGSPTAQRTLTIGDTSQWISIGASTATATDTNMYVSQTSPSSTNYSLRLTAADSVMSAPNSGGSLILAIAGVNKISLTNTTLSFALTAPSSGSTASYTFTAPNGTGRTASTAVSKFLFTQGTTQWSTGALAANQNFFYITQAGMKFVSSSTSTLASNFTIAGAVDASSSATITTSVGLLIESAAVNSAGTVTTAYSAYFNAPTGAGTNYALGLAGNLNIVDANNIVIGTTTGTKIGTATSQKLSFFNATPIIQPASASAAAVATTAATNVAPYGYTTQAQADGIITLINELRLELVNLGLIKGAA